MRTAVSFGTLVLIYQATLRQIPEESNVFSHVRAAIESRFLVSVDHLFLITQLPDVMIRLPPTTSHPADVPALMRNPAVITEISENASVKDDAWGNEGHRLGTG